MKIAIANSRTDKKLKNKEMSWEEFTKRCSSTIRTTETVEEYRKMNKGDKANIKDRGGFVAGELKEGRRKNGMVRCRSALTLDMDYAEPGSWERITLLFDFKCCVYSTDSSYRLPVIFPKKSIRLWLVWLPRKSALTFSMTQLMKPAV